LKSTPTWWNAQGRFATSFFFTSWTSAPAARVVRLLDTPIEIRMNNELTAKLTDHVACLESAPPSKTRSISTIRTPRLHDVEICRVRDRRGREAFLRIPWRIYADDPIWVPPLLHERREFISAKHPFYQHGFAALFLARRGGRDVGRILVSDDPHYNQVHGTNTGCFGMFESIDDPSVAHALLDAAADWLAARGRTEIIGPIDYSTNYPCGLLVDGFDTPPRVMMNHNPPYYARLLQSWGLEKAKDLMAWWLATDDYINGIWKSRILRFAERTTVQVRPFNIKDAKADIRRCKVVYDGAWQRNWGFVRMTDAEFFHFAENLLTLLDPSLLLLAEVNGEPVGFTLTLPDFNEAVRPLNGRLFRWGLPLGLLKFHRNCRKIVTGRVITLGVLEDHRRRGIVEMLILKTLENTRGLGFTHVELGWTLEDNTSINRLGDAVGASRYKTYRIYHKEIVTSRCAE
jgi:GNAT superfamily N-acetyltransferase